MNARRAAASTFGMKHLGAMTLACLAFAAPAAADPAWTLGTATDAHPCPAGTTCKKLEIDPRCDLALASTTTGVRAATAKDVLAGYTAFHAAKNVNDGWIGNDSAWVSGSAESWLLLDLGKVTTFDIVRFGRDRVGTFDDRDPGGVAVYTSAADAAAPDDAAAWTLQLDGLINGTGALGKGQTAQLQLPAPIGARYVKLVFHKAGVAIDEVELNDSTVTVAGRVDCVMVDGRRPVVAPVVPWAAFWMDLTTSYKTRDVLLYLGWGIAIRGNQSPAGEWLRVDGDEPAVRPATAAAYPSLFRASHLGLSAAGTTPRTVRYSRGDLIATSGVAGDAVLLGRTGLMIDGKVTDSCLMPQLGTGTHVEGFHPVFAFPGTECPFESSPTAPVRGAPVVVRVVQPF